MKQPLLIVVTLAICCNPHGMAQQIEKFLRMPDSLIGFNTPAGRELLLSSHASEPFWELAQFYAPQPDLASCSAATCAMVLNAMSVARPTSPSIEPNRLFTADNMFTPEVSKIVSRKNVSSGGMNLDQLSRVLSTFPIKVERIYASSSNADAFRQVVVKTLAVPNQHVIVNYLRRYARSELGRPHQPSWGIQWRTRHGACAGHCKLQIPLDVGFSGYALAGDGGRS